MSVCLSCSGSADLDTASWVRMETAAGVGGFPLCPAYPISGLRSRKRCHLVPRKQSVSESFSSPSLVVIVGSLFFLHHQTNPIPLKWRVQRGRKAENPLECGSLLWQMPGCQSDVGGGFFIRFFLLVCLKTRVTQYCWPSSVSYLSVCFPMAEDSLFTVILAWCALYVSANCLICHVGFLQPSLKQEGMNGLWFKLPGSPINLRDSFLRSLIALPKCTLECLLWPLRCPQFPEGSWETLAGDNLFCVLFRLWLTQVNFFFLVDSLSTSELLLSPHLLFSSCYPL